MTKLTQGRTDDLVYQKFIGHRLQSYGRYVNHLSLMNMQRKPHLHTFPIPEDLFRQKVKEHKLRKLICPRSAY